MVMYPIVVMLGIKGIRSLSEGPETRARSSPWPAITALMITAPIVVIDLKAETLRSTLVFFSFFWIVLLLPGLGVWRYGAAAREAIEKGSIVPFKIQAVTATLGVFGVAIVIILTNLLGGVGTHR
jgi:hypothetical protein